MTTTNDRPGGGEDTPLASGDVLVPRAGPGTRARRLARGAGTLLTVLHVTRHGLDVAHRIGDEHPELVASREQLADRYERPDGTAL